jgi:putative mRNA 3-end processing factor
VERRFADAVRETLYEGGTVVVPAFAIGRTQEMLLKIADFKVRHTCLVKSPCPR